MTVSLTQLLAVSALLSAAEKAVEGRALSRRDEETMRTAVEHVRAAFTTFDHRQKEEAQAL